MSSRKPAPTALESFYNVKQAAIRLGLQDPSKPESEAGERWLRDGVNNKGFPARRMSGVLMFSDSDLAEIAELSRVASTAATRNRRTSRRRPTPIASAA